MAKMMYREAVRNTIFQEMKRDDSVVVLGEDVVGGMRESLQHACSALDICICLHLSAELCYHF